MRNWLAMVLVVCGGCGGAGGTMMTDPLVGTWRTTISTGAGSTATLDLQFKSDKAFITLVTSDESTTALFNPGCHRVETHTGATWSTGDVRFADGTIAPGLTVTTSTAGTVVQTACTNAADNGTKDAATQFDGTSNGYVISGSTLTLSDANKKETKYTKQ